MRILSLIGACFIFDTVAHAQGLDAIFVSQTTGEIDNIVASSGNSNTLYTATGHFWNGAAYDPLNGLVYIDDIGSSTFTVNQVITNTIYSFNPLNPSAGVTSVGTISGQAALTGAGFYNGLYYAVASGSNQLVAYNVSGGTITQVSSQTLGGLGKNVSGLYLGDLDFVGSTLYISAATVNGNTVGNYELLKYTTVTNTTTTAYTVAESKYGVGISNDINSGDLIIYNSDGTLDLVNQTTGALTPYSTLSGPAASAGSGDFTIVPEPREYAMLIMLLLVGLIGLHRAAGSRLQTRLA